jgi:hypothetical protein
MESVKLAKGQRVSFCLKDGIHVIEIYAGHSRKLIGRLEHPPELTTHCGNNDIEDFIKAKAREVGLEAEPIPFLSCEFIIK